MLVVLGGDAIVANLDLSDCRDDFTFFDYTSFQAMVISNKMRNLIAYYEKLNRFLAENWRSQSQKSLRELSCQRSNGHELEVYSFGAHAS